MKIRMKDNYGIEYDGVQPHHDPMGLWKWSVDHTDGAFAGTRVMFSAMVWEPVPDKPEKIEAILIAGDGWRKSMLVDRGSNCVVVPVRLGLGSASFGQTQFFRTAEVIDGKVVYRQE